LALPFAVAASRDAASRRCSIARRNDGEIPLVDDDDHGAAGLFGVAGDLRVALRYPLLAVNDEESDIASLQAAAGHDHAEFFRDQRGFSFAANSRGVHEAIRPAIAGNFPVHVVHGGARSGRDDGAFFADQAIQQRGFADVGSADDGDFDDVVLLFFLDGCDDADLCQRRIEEIVNASAVLGRNRENRDANAIENGGVGFLRHGIHFVYGDDKWFAGGAQEACQFFVEGRKSGLAIHHQDEQCGLLDGHMRLAQDFLRDYGFVVRNDAPGIDDFQRAAAPLCLAVNPIARYARLVGDDGAACAGQTVEERGLAHVGAAHNDERW
jgi:hypothetical protein